MFIAIVDLTVSPADRAAALTALADLEPVVRAMPGCRSLRHVVAPDDPGTITVLHEWEDQDRFRAYASSATFAQVSAILRPIAAGPPVSRRFTAELVEQVD